MHLLNKSLPFQSLTSYIRIRHIKCDEQKPSCLKCTSTGRVCDGYSAANKHSQNGGSDDQLIMHPLSVSKALTKTVMSNDQEYRAFHFFQSQTAPQLSSALGSSLWFSLILQISHHTPAVRHAVIAMGSLGERLIINGILTAENLEANKRHEFAHAQYYKAIRELRRQLSSEPGRSTEAALICCFLFICFEFLQGNDIGALTHLKSGLDIILRSQVKPIKIKTIWHSSPCSDQGDFLSSATQLFGLVDSIAALWIGEKSLQNSVIEDGQIYTPVPKTFSTLEEATQSFIRLADQVTYLQETVNGPRYETLSREDLLAANAKQDYLVSQFESWLLLFQSLLEQSRKDFSVEDIYQVTILKVNFKIYLMKLGATLNANEATIYDQHDSTFEDIILYSTSLLRSIKTSLDITILSKCRNPFEFNEGAIQPLYFTAIKCCNRKICWKAISLLSATPWREGAWESTSMASIANRKVRQREEQGFYNR